MDLAEIDRRLAEIRSKPKSDIFDADDVMYLRLLAAKLRLGNAAFNPDWFDSMANVLERTLARMQDLQFAPSGDNHHNAALCPYCGEPLRKAEKRIAELEQEVGFWLGEGQEERPEVVEYRSLAGTKNRTAAETNRLKELSATLMDDSRTNLDLLDRIAELEAENEHLRNPKLPPCGMPSHSDDCDCGGMGGDR